MSEQTIKTPRTDAQLHYPVDFGIAVNIGFARQLEVENQQLRSVLTDVVDAYTNEIAAIFNGLHEEEAKWFTKGAALRIVARELLEKLPT